MTTFKDQSDFYQIFMGVVLRANDVIENRNKFKLNFTATS
ncbi:hypothetical protein CEAn_00488 [Coxiella endosymbiont of Amblyomma nuttalli]|nr:hypothetical protein CEAn_00488 [Coxiella endosymbiont of Amblyomma nuttalli]